jgi:hypothetical protein
MYLSLPHYLAYFRQFDPFMKPGVRRSVLLLDRGISDLTLVLWWIFISSYSIVEAIHH